MTADAEGLLAAVRQSPADDWPRLLYADWLEEFGDEFQRARAEFIRDGIALCHPEMLNPDHDMGEGWDGVIDIIAQYAPPAGHCPLCAAICRQRASPCSQAIAGGIGKVVGMPADWSGRKDSGRNYVGVRCRRGFAAEVRLPLEEWRRHGGEVLAAHPIEWVGDNGKAPRASPGQPGAWEWWGEWDGTVEGEEDPDDLPADVFALLKGGTLHRGDGRPPSWRVYRRKDDAEADLSQALLALHRPGGPPR